MRMRISPFALMIGLALMTSPCGAQTNAPPRSVVGGPLNLSDFGSFFVGGRTVRSEHPGSPATGLLEPGNITVDQMYVHYMKPATVSGPPVVMVHGFNHTGTTFETTPDGREGWATYFARKGHPVYVVDQPGRGRSGFDPTSFNRAKNTGDTSAIQNVPLYPLKSAWVNFRFGKEYPTPFPGMKFPLEALDTYTKQLVPSAESTLQGGVAVAPEDLALLLDRIGPAVMLGHSQASGMVIAAIKKRPALTAAFVSVEGDCIPVTQDDGGKVFGEVPILSVFGDNSVGAAGFNGDARRQGCIDAVKFARERGGKAEFTLLSEHGMPGHTHMMMMDQGNLTIADLIITWIQKAGATERYAALTKPR